MVTNQVKVGSKVKIVVFFALLATETGLKIAANSNLVKMLPRG